MNTYESYILKKIEDTRQERERLMNLEDTGGLKFGNKDWAYWSLFYMNEAQCDILHQVLTAHDNTESMRIEAAKLKLWSAIKNTEGVEGIGITRLNKRDVIKVLVSRDSIKGLPTEYEGHTVIIQNTGKIILL